MAFTFDDFVQKVNGGDLNKKHRERFSSEVADLRPQSLDEIKEMFPGVKLGSSENIVYVPFKIMHSLPYVNERKRCFTPQTMANSVGSAVDNLIDMEHTLVNNDVGREVEDDIIVGHIKAAMLDPKRAAEVANSIPTSPIPLYGLGALFMRSPRVQSVVEQHISGKKRWMVSYELLHKWADAEFLYRGEFIPIKEAPPEMLEGVGRTGIKPYKSHDVAAVLSGRNGKVDMYGLGLTTNPADGGAEILSMVSGMSQELASKNIFYSPMRMKTFPSLELATKGVDKIVTELANIEIIGETHPGGKDSHTHKILSDLSILDTCDHSHEIANQNLSMGIRPRFTGRTTSHRVYGVPGHDYHNVGENTYSHSHTFDISLRQKQKSTEVASASQQGESDMKLSEMNQRLEKLTTEVASLSTVKTDQQASAITSVQSSLGELVSEFRKSSQKEMISAEIADAIAAKVESGELVTKENSAALAEVAAKNAVAAKEAELNEVNKRASRVQRLKDAGIDVTMGFNENIKDAKGQPLTILQYIESLACDVGGDQTFEIQFSFLAEMLKKDKEHVDTAAETKVAAAANKPRMLLTAGGGAPSFSGGNGSDLPAGRRHTLGRGIFSK